MNTAEGEAGVALGVDGRDPHLLQWPKGLVGAGKPFEAMCLRVEGRRLFRV